MKTVSAFLAMAGLSLFMSVTNVSAQDQPPTLPPCIIINGVKCYVQYNDCGQIINISCAQGSSGTAQFRLLAPGEDCAPDDATDLDPSAGVPLNAFLRPENIDVVVPDPNLGLIRTTFDDSRVASNTTVTSNPESGEVFPLKVRIKFYALAQLESNPDEVYVSQTELVFGNDEVNSVAPFENETFTLLNSVGYYRQGDESQAIVFSLEAGSTSLTIGGEDDRDDNLLE